MARKETVAIGGPRVNLYKSKSLCDVVRAIALGVRLLS